VPDFPEFLAAVHLAIQRADAPAAASAFVDKFHAKLELKYDLLARGEISLNEFRDGVNASDLLPKDKRLRDWLVNLIVTTAARLLELGTARAKPQARQPKILDREEVELGIRRGRGAGAASGEPKRAAKPVAGNGGGAGEPRPPRIVSTGFATRAAAGGGLDRAEPLIPKSRYFYWLEIGSRAAPHALAPSALPSEVPAKAELTVVLFAPDGGLIIEQDAGVGWLHLLRDGTAHVSQRPGPATLYDHVPQDVLDRRLLFPIQTPAKPGHYSMRVSIYRRGVLIESRRTQVAVGTQPADGTDALSEIVDYSLSQRYAAATLDEMPPHDLSIMINSNGDGNHDFYFYGANKSTEVQKAVTISASTLSGAIGLARQALREVSWGDAGEWDSSKKYRYEALGGAQSRQDQLARLTPDLARLAGRGFDVYNLIVKNLTAKTTRAQLEKLLSAPGMLQIASKEDIRFVLPAGMIYDYKVDNQIPFATWKICPEFEQAFLKGTSLLSTPCFQGKCPSRPPVTPPVVCPSGFWGFRHKLGLPISLQDAGTPTETAIRVQYKDVPVMVLAVSTDPDLKLREAHEKDIRGLEAAWSQRAWFLGETRETALQLLGKSKPHLVYFYCHGGLSADKKFYLSIGAPGDGSYIVPSNLDVYVSWEEPPHPLVFINGCHTTAMDADTTLEFVTEFVQVIQACGVIGTEITVFESLAGTFGKIFWREFLKGGIGVGEAIRSARLELLEAGNPLGLVYTPFVLAGTKLEKTA
jgi:hypothetical protein